MSERKLVSVCMITYNHEQFIGQAIDAVVNQKANFEFELIIGEDCSTDNTRKVCEQYAAQYPDIIKLLPSDKNLGVSANFYRTLYACCGDYIAICEGDDYWVNELKLQKQVMIFETNPHVALVSAKADYVTEGKPVSGSKDDNESSYQEGFFGIEGLINEWKCQTLTVMFRKKMADFNKLRSYRVLYDTMLFYELLKKGTGYYLNEVVGVYRQHSTGAWNGKTEQQKLKFIISQFYEIWSKNKSDVAIRNKLGQSLIDYLRGATFFSSKERKYYLQSVIHYLQVTKDFKYLKLLFINHVRHLRSN